MLVSRVHNRSRYVSTSYASHSPFRVGCEGGTCARIFSNGRSRAVYCACHPKPWESIPPAHPINAGFNDTAGGFSKVGFPRPLKKRFRLKAKKKSLQPVSAHHPQKIKKSLRTKSPYEKSPTTPNDLRPRGCTTAITSARKRGPSGSICQRGKNKRPRVASRHVPG